MSEPPRHHPIARLALAIGLVMAAYASLRPFTGWKDRGVGAFAFLHGTLAFPNHWDVFLNTVGYLLLGVAAVLSLAPRVRGPAAVAVATCGLAITSLGVEALQTFLPGRLASLTDVVTNVGGAIAGGFLALWLSPRLAAQGGAAGLRRRWFAPGVTGDFGILLLAFWLAGLLAPRILLFGMGDFRFLLPFHGHVILVPTEYVRAEAVIASLNAAAIGLLVRVILAEGAPRAALFSALVAAAIVARSVGYGLFWGADHAFDWLTRGAWIGLAVGVPAGFAMLLVPRRFAAPAGALLLAGTITAVNLAPPNPFIFARPRPTRMMELEPLSAVTRSTAMLWPFVAAVFLAWPRRREPRG